MKLVRVDIQNFRSIKSVSINFDLKCRILVGINESGKTNILRALAFLDPEKPITPDDLRNFPPDEDPAQEAYVLFVFSLEKSERITIYENVAEKLLVNKPSAPIISFGDKELTLAQFINSRTEGLYKIDITKEARFATTWKLQDGYSIAGSWFKPSPECSPNFHVNKKDDAKLPLGSITLIHGSAVEGIPVEYLAAATIDDVLSVVRSHIVSFVGKNLPDSLYWTYSDSHLLPPQIGLDSFASNPGKCEPLRHMFALADIDDISAEVVAARNRSNGIRNLLNRVADRATKHIQSVWKEYRGLKIELSPNGPNVDASIKDEHNLYDFSRRSDGFKRFISFLLMVSAKVRTQSLVNTLIIHDEPDISLHPSGARYLRDELIKISENNYVVYSTHSIFMIDRELLRRHLIVEKKSEITSVREVDESNIVDEEVIYNALGHSIFENLKQSNIIFEGWRDKRLFRVSLKTVPTKHKSLKAAFDEIGICHARGVKDIGRITPMLELAGRSWVVLSDGDKPALEQQRRYDGIGPWFRYDELASNTGVLTGEDFVKPEFFKSQIEAIRSEYPSLGDLLVDRLSSGESKLVVLRRWLMQGGISAESCKAILEAIKERIFESLKPSHIDEKYYEFLAQLLEKVKEAAKKVE